MVHLCNLSHSKEGFLFGNCCKLFNSRILPITSVFRFAIFASYLVTLGDDVPRWTFLKKFLHYSRKKLRTDNSWTMSSDISDTVLALAEELAAFLSCFPVEWLLCIFIENNWYSCDFLHLKVKDFPWTNQIALSEKKNWSWCFSSRRKLKC